MSLVLVTFVGTAANAVELFFFDYDGTIVRPNKTDRNASGIYDSKIVLFRLENRPNLYIDIENEERVIEVSSHDLKHKLTRINEETNLEESLLAEKDGRLGFSTKRVTLSDGRQIIPGIYRIVVPESFKYYRESPKSRNYLLEDFKKSEELETRKIGTFKGPFWSQMVNLLSNEESAKQFGLITARGHAIREWKEFFEYLKERGYIKYLPDFKNIHNINRPEYEKFGMGDGDSIRKVGLLKQIIAEMSTRKYKESDLRLHPNGEEAVRIHSLSFVDDNQKTLELAYDELRSLALRQTNVKIILSNAGLDHEVTKSRRPRSFVLTYDGVVRPATDFEIYGEPTHQKNSRFVGAKNSRELEKSLEKSCVGFFN